MCSVWKVLNTFVFSFLSIPFKYWYPKWGINPKKGTVFKKTRACFIKGQGPRKPSVHRMKKKIKKKRFLRLFHLFWVQK